MKCLSDWFVNGTVDLASIATHPDQFNRVNTTYKAMHFLNIDGKPITGTYDVDEENCPNQNCVVGGCQYFQGMPNLFLSFFLPTYTVPLILRRICCLLWQAQDLYSKRSFHALFPHSLHWRPTPTIARMIHIFFFPAADRDRFRTEAIMVVTL
jgi:hypothetical protein